MILSFFDITEEERTKFSLLPSGHSYSYYVDSLTVENVKRVRNTEILYIRSFSLASATILRQLPRLRFIATRSTGFDNIDIDYCKQNKIVISNVPSYATNAVAEHTFGLLLSLSHNITSCVETSRTGHYIVGPQGYDITGKTIGIVGFGNIGTRVADIAKGFNMNILVNTKHPELKSHKIKGVTFVNFQMLLKSSDVISFHVPLTHETYHMLNMKNISFLKKGSVLLNTSRGEVIETKAIHWALQKNMLLGVGLDVLEEELALKSHESLPDSACSHVVKLNYEFMKDRRVLVTPHNAYHTKEALDTILRISAENIAAFLKGKPINRVV